MARLLGPGFLAVAMLASPATGLQAGEVLPLCAIPSISSDGLTLLLDPVEHTPIATVTDPEGRLASFDGPVVLQTQWPVPDSNNLPQLELEDVLPEYWMEPAVWQTFQRGPEAYSGWGNELRPANWAGMPMTDRRSYRLDPGLQPEPTPDSLAPPGVGRIKVETFNGGWRLTWTSGVGRIYQVYFASELDQPFRLTQTLISGAQGEASVVVPTPGNQGFYRLAEVTP